MRIALSGASSSGKTTLASAYAKCAPNLIQMNVDARKLLDRMHMRHVGAMTPQAYAIFQRRYISAKIRNERRLDNYLTERSFVDAYAYWVFHCNEIAEERENRQVQKICEKFARRYDLHFFLPYGLVPHDDDGYRHKNPAYHKLISNSILEILQSWRLTFVCLDTPNLEERIARLRQVVGK